MERVSKSRKSREQRLRQLERKRMDVGIIKRIKDRRGQKGNFEYLVEWQGCTDDSRHKEIYLPDESIQNFKDEYVRFIVRRHKWQQTLFE